MLAVEGRILLRFLFGDVVNGVEDDVLEVANVFVRDRMAQNLVARALAEV